MANTRTEAVLLYINTGTVGTPVWTAVVNELGCTLSMTAGEIDITNKDSSYWKESISGMRSWNVSGNALFVASNTVLAFLEAAWLNHDDSNGVKMKTLNGNMFYGVGILTSFSYDASAPNQVAKVSLTINGTGALTRATAA